VFELHPLDARLAPNRARALRLTVFWRGAIVGALLALAACDGEAPADNPEYGTAIELTAAEQAEVQATFDDAACVCEAIALLTQAELSDQFASRAIDVRRKLIPTTTGDTALQGYASRQISGGQRRFCRTVSPASARGSVPRRTLGTDATSSCVAEWNAFPATSTAPNPRGPLCVAELDYCLANELRLEAQSFIKGPSSAAVRIEIERLATARAARAIRGYGVRLNECADTPSLARCTLLAGRSLTPLGSAVSARFADAVETVSDLAQASYDDRLALSDAVPPPAEALNVLLPDGGIAAPSDDSAAYMNAVWNGPTGRGEAIEPFYGSGGAPIRTTTQAYDDPSVGRALWLADLYDLPTSYALVYFRLTLGSEYRAERLLPLSGAARSTRATALFNLLDLRLAYARGETPEFVDGPPSAATLDRINRGALLFVEDLTALETARLARSTARTVYGLAPEHLAAAMDLAFDLFETMQVDFLARPSLQLVESGITHVFHAIDLRAIDQADDRLVLWRRQELDSATPLVPVATTTIRASSTASWYASQLVPDDVGVASVLHQARVMALRLQTRAGPIGANFAPDLLPAQSLIGSQWTEFARDRINATGTGTLPLPAPRWALYSRTSERVFGATYHLVPLATASCLVRGPTGSLVACRPMRAAMVCPESFGVFRNYSRTLCTLPFDPGTTDPYAIVRSSPVEDGTRLIEIIDTVPATRNSVHTLGGVLEEQALRALARTPLAPAYPLINSLGFERGTVPPLENSLTSGGAAGEDSWRQYLAQAQAQAADATIRLRVAREAELQGLLNAGSDEAIIEAAAIQSTYERAELCGDSTTCALSRVPSSLLGALPLRDPVEGPTRVVVSKYGIMAPLPMDCPEMLARPPASPPEPADRLAEAKEYVDCLARVVDVRLQQLAVLNLPEALVSALSESSTGDFPDYAGQQREILIRIFDQLAKIHTEQRNFNTAITATNARFAALLTIIDELDNPALEFACYLDIAMAWVKVAIAIWGGGGSAKEELSALQATANIENCSTENARGSLAISASAGASASMSGAYVALDAMFSAKAEIDLAINELDSIAAQASASTASVESAADVASTSAIEDLEEWKFQQTAAAQQARGALRNAQVLAYAARRAIEFRTLTNLSQRNRDEPFVEAPSTWVDQLTQLQFATVAPGVSAAPEAIDDYVTQLRGFVNGYPFTQRFSEGRDVLTLSLRSYLYETGRRPIVRLPEPQPLPSSVWRLLRYTCRNATIEEEPSGFSDGVVPCALGGGVAFAEVDIAVDSGVDSPVGRRLAPGGYNHRIAALGINLVASQLVDCDRLPVSARFECRGDGNVQYAVEQSSIAAATDWDGELRGFSVGPGRIEGARALAAERYLTTPLSASDGALIAPYLRRELVGRPLFSDVRVRFYDRPGLDWTKLNDVQLLVEYVRWEQQR